MWQSADGSERLSFGLGFRVSMSRSVRLLELVTHLRRWIERVLACDLEPACHTATLPACTACGHSRDNKACVGVCYKHLLAVCTGLPTWQKYVPRSERSTAFLSLTSEMATPGSPDHNSCCSCPCTLHLCDHEHPLAFAMETPARDVRARARTGQAQYISCPHVASRLIPLVFL